MITLSNGQTYNNMTKQSEANDFQGREHETELSQQRHLTMLDFLKTMNMVRNDTLCCVRYDVEAIAVNKHVLFHCKDAKHRTQVERNRASGEQIGADTFHCVILLNAVQSHGQLDLC